MNFCNYFAAYHSWVRSLPGLVDNSRTHSFCWNFIDVTLADDDAYLRAVAKNWGGQEATRAVDKRAGELNAEYLAKAKHTDQAYCGTARDTTGPVERKLGSLGRVHGIVIGAFGEASDDLHSLLHHLAVSRVRYAGP